MKIMMLSGITGSGKSTLFKKMMTECKKLNFSSVFFLSAYHSQNAYKDLEKSLQEFYETIEEFLAILERMEGKKEIGLLLENSMSNSFIENEVTKELEERVLDSLRKHDTKQVLLQMDEDYIEERSVLLTKKYRAPAWHAYLDSLHLNTQELTQMFKEKQSKLKQVHAENNLEGFILNTTAMEWQDYVDKIIDFWQS
ncbi:ATP-binding protein [Enterococcus sp. AZ192]|uniref:ATP-binding protein n=1 Tax=unclassified Enterococcus TaxID=2608891 RepID=UPI003D2A0FB8